MNMQLAVMIVCFHHTSKLGWQAHNLMNMHDRCFYIRVVFS